MTSVGEGRSYVLPKKCGLWWAMTECSCDVGGVKRMGRNWCGTAAELVMGPASSQTQRVLSTGLAKGRHKLLLEVLP